MTSKNPSHRLALLFTLGAFFFAHGAWSFTGAGSGTFAAPYLITDVTQLQEMNLDLAAHYALDADIDASGTAGWNTGKGFLPIAPDTDSEEGHQGDRFNGSFDGRGHAITGLFIFRPFEEGVGLFGSIEEATIQNVAMVIGNVTGGTSVGGLVGIMHGGIISNGSSTMAVSGGSDNIGGLIGHSQMGTVWNGSAAGVVSGGDYVGGLIGSCGSAVSNCHAQGSVYGSDNVGGLVGSGGVLRYCYSIGPVSGTNNVGGLVGSGGVLRFCHSIGPVSGSNRVGGLIGSAYGTVFRSYATGNVSGQESIGGLVGVFSGTGITDCYASGSASGLYSVGGLIGLYDPNATQVRNCFATGDVSSRFSFQAGGLVGSFFFGTFNSCYWDTDASGTTVGVGNTVPDPLGVNGKTTVKMYQQSTFLGWDFDKIWTIDESNDYPRLGFFSVAHTITTLEELQAMKYDLEGDYVLANDVDASDTSTWNGGAGFQPIGDATDTFTGSFDGQGHTITGLFIDRPSTDNVGLFGYTDGATLENIATEGGSVTGLSSVGGLVGFNSNGAVSGCNTTGPVATGVGGSVAGGLVGSNWNSVVSDCYSLSPVTGFIVGGLVGNNTLGSLSNSYSAGAVSGTGSLTGGFVGINGATCTACYWDTETSGTADGVGNASPDSPGVVGKTTVEMYAQTTFAGWDFASTWWIDEGNDYPRFLSALPPTATPTPTIAVIPTATHTPTSTETPIATNSPTATDVPTLESTSTPTPTDTVPPSPSVTPTEPVLPTRTFDYDFDENGVVDARDLVTLIEQLGALENAGLFDFNRFWLE